MGRRVRRLARGRPVAGGAGRVTLPGLRERRSVAGLSQAELGRAIGAITIQGERGPSVTGRTISEWERGGAAHADVVPYLLRALGCKRAQLMEATAA